MYYVKRFYQVIKNYAIGRLAGQPTTAAFWYLPEKARVTDSLSLKRYFDRGELGPLYLMDYSSKLKYKYTNQSGIIVLPYDPPVGDQVCPEAAFQYALALYDRYIETKDSESLDKFLYYAEYFVQRQTPDGDWFYQFDWYGSKAPWSSALAQSRGASVMLRAGLHTGERRYFRAAVLALSKFDKPVEEGGYLSYFRPEKTPYFEEYPKEPSAALNGFMAALFGPWEVMVWLRNSHAESLWRLGIESLQRMLGYYTLSWWTVYDFDPQSPVLNVHSPRYHSLVIEYLKILNAISPNKVFSHYLKTWVKQNRASNKAAAIAYKLYRKVVYR